MTSFDRIVVMLLLGTRDECNQEFIHKFARKYSLPTHEYNNPPNINQFRRYSIWLTYRKKLDEFITKSQRQTNSPNEAYLEWIPSMATYGKLPDRLPTHRNVVQIQLEITDNKNNYIITR